MIALFVVVVALVLLANRLAVPYPVLLVVGGLLLGFVPGLPSLELQPDLVFLLFLPPLLYSDALTTSWRDFRANQRSIGWLAIGLVIGTTCGVAVVAHLAIADLNWPLSFLLGAIVSSTDAVAASSIFSRLGVPDRVEIIVRGESLVNDASALVVYGTAVTAVVAGTFSLPLAAAQFVFVSIGGIVIGLGAGWLGMLIRRRLRENDPVIETAVALLTPFVAYLPAEQLGVSGVLAVVTTGLYVGRKSPAEIPSAVRLQATALWELVSFLINGLVFILIGLQLRSVLRAIASRPAGTLVVDAVLISLVVILLRIFWVFPAMFLAHIQHHQAENDPVLPWRPVSVVAWSGMRGVVTLATALALPLEAHGRPFPQRDLLVFLTFGVILFTLVLQGLSLPGLIKILGVGQDDTEQREEELARAATARAALALLDQSTDRPYMRKGLVEGIRASYLRRLEHLDAHTRGAIEDGHPQPAHDLRKELIDVERFTLIDLRNRNVISDTVLRRIQKELDLEELRIAAGRETR